MVADGEMPAEPVRRPGGGYRVTHFVLARGAVVSPDKGAMKFVLVEDQVMFRGLIRRMLVEECRGQGLAYVYLGYWISDSPKMAYKARFPALEQLADGRWSPFVDAGA